MSSNVSIEILRQNRTDLTTIRRIVGQAIAGAMLRRYESGPVMAWHLAEALNAEGLDIEWPIRNGFKGLGADYGKNWVIPAALTPWASSAGPQELPEATAEAVDSPLMEKVLAVVVDHLIEMATSYDESLRSRAKHFTRDLDGVGLPIDRLIEDRSQETGHGPYLCDMFGHRYDLTRQWFDRRGKRWEYTGSWSDVGGPVLRMDEPDGEAMVLAELIRERGPLYAATPAPKAPEQPVDCPF
jgi:hypothetical protein